MCVLLFSSVSTVKRAVISVGALVLGGVLLIALYDDAAGFTFQAVEFTFQAASELVYTLLGLAVFLVALTISTIMGIIAWRLYKLPANASLSDWQPGLTAGSVGLFGTLIAGVFVITTFRIDSRFERAEEQLREDVTEDVLGVFDSRIQEAMRVASQRHVGEQVVYGRTDESFGSPPYIELGQVNRLHLSADERASRQLALTTAGTYQVDVQAVSDGFDPVVYLYEADPNDGEWTVLEFNNDFQGGKNSRIEPNLDAEKYYIEIKELLGKPGTCILLVQKLD